MKKEQDSDETAAPKRVFKFTPKALPRKLPKRSNAKTEPSKTKDDFIDKELLSKLNCAKQSHDGFGRGVSKTQREVAPVQVAFGYRDTSKARSFGKPRVGNEHQESLDVQSTRTKKDYKVPWDYSHSYYPTVLPLRRPYSGNPDILDKEEFGEASASSSAPVEAPINPASELGLMEMSDEPQMLFLQFPAYLPSGKQNFGTTGSKMTAVGSKMTGGSNKGCRLQNLPAGYMGKLLVYKSGSVKIKLGDTFLDVSPGIKCTFAQDVAVINAKEKHCCILGAINKRAVITPDVDYLV